MLLVVLIVVYIIFICVAGVVGDVVVATICRALPCFKPLGNYNLQGFALCQATGGFQFVGYGFAQAIGSAISKFVSCVKLLGKYNLQGLLCVQLLVNCILQGFALCLTLVLFASSYWGIAISRLLSCAICTVVCCTTLLGHYLSSYWGITTCRVLLRVKLLWKYNYFAFPQAIAALQFRVSCVVSRYWGIPITICMVLFCPKLLGDYNYNWHGRFRFVIFLRHAKSVFDCGSS